MKEYYEVEGKEDSVFIFFRPGSYIPVFRTKDSDAELPFLAVDPQFDSVRDLPRVAEIVTKTK